MIRSRRQRIFRGYEIVDELPYDVENATVVPYRDNEVIFEGSCPTRIPEFNHAFMTFNEYILSLPVPQQRILEHINFPDDGIHIANAIRNKNALGVTDALYETTTNIGAAAWVIVGEVDDIYCEGRIGQPRTRTETDPYRAESLGILGMITAIEYLCIYHKI